MSSTTLVISLLWNFTADSRIKLQLLWIRW